MVIPSIDLMKGKAVQLRRGREKQLERDDPLACAESFRKFGEIALIDLDAALGTGENRKLIERIVKIADCRIGGGIRTVKDAKEYLMMGATKVIVGSRAFHNGRINSGFLEELKAAVGKGHIIIAVDAFDGEIVTAGWRRKTGLDVRAVIPCLGDFAGELLFTCVENEGTLQGINMKRVKSLAALSSVRMTVAGGISTLEEVAQCARLGVDVQLGMAIYTGLMTLPEAFTACVNWGKGLVPTIATDEAGQVLMLAYSSLESLQRTLETETMWYFSRSRDQLWMKGETSGNVQELLSIRLDCDGDTLLAVVKPDGPSCHRGNYSCFGRKRFSLKELFDTVSERLEYPHKDSYTATLTEEALHGKLLEEIGELLTAQTREEVIWEGADLLYFLSVLLTKRGVVLEQVLNELRRRSLERKPGN